MTPSELMALADDIEKGQLGYRRKATAALRSYAELLSQLSYLQERRQEFTYVKLEPFAIESAARFAGWPGLED